MSFGGGLGGNGSIAGSSDVSLNSPISGQDLTYDSATSKWVNQGLTGRAALADQGGAENVVQNFTASGNVTLDLSQGNLFRITLTGNVTFTFTGATDNKACSFALHLRQDTSGSHAVTWPAGVKWSDGEVPSVSSAASAYDIFVFESITGGNDWFGSLVGNNFS